MLLTMRGIDRSFGPDRGPNKGDYDTAPAEIAALSGAKLAGKAMQLPLAGANAAGGGLVSGARKSEGIPPDMTPRANAPTS